MTNSRDIMTEIIVRKRCPERMGVYEHFWDDTKPEWERRDGLPPGTDLTSYFDYDLRQVGGWCFNHESLIDGGSFVSEDETTKVVINGYGAKMRYWKHRAGTPEHLGFDLTSREIWEKKYREPLLGYDPRRLGDTAKLKQGLADAKKEGRFTVLNHLFIFEIMRASMGDVVMLESMYLDPEWITDFCTVNTDLYITHLDRVFSDAGLPDGMWIYEDMGFTKAPFISPELYRELILPHHRRLVNYIHDCGIPVIMHSCGNIRPLLPDIAASGIDCLQVLEAKAGQHVAEFAQATGNKRSFMGNLNIVALETNDRAAIDAEIIPKLDAVRKNRVPYVFHSDHSIPKSVTLDTYRYVRDLHRKLGHY